jgi:hypothetical protein
MHQPIGKPPVSLGVKFYLKHLAIAFGVGIAILTVTYIGLAVIYGPFVPFQTESSKSIIVRPQPPAR